MQEDTLIVTKAAEVVQSEFTPLIHTLESFARWATKEDDADALAKLDDALEAVLIMSSGIWEINKSVDPDTSARFQQRRVAVGLSIVVRALADLPRETIQAEVEKFRNWQAARNSAVQNRRADAEREDLRRRESEMVEKARRMPIEKAIREIESTGVRLEADEEDRIFVYGQLSYGAKLIMNAKRAEIINFLRTRQTPSAIV
jgi:hypothetical protein